MPPSRKAATHRGARAATANDSASARTVNSRPAPRGAGPNAEPTSGRNGPVVGNRAVPTVRAAAVRHAGASPAIRMATADPGLPGTRPVRVGAARPRTARGARASNGTPRIGKIATGTGRAATASGARHGNPAVAARRRRPGANGPSNAMPMGTAGPTATNRVPRRHVPIVLPAMTVVPMTGALIRRPGCTIHGICAVPTVRIASGLRKSTKVSPGQSWTG